MLRVPSAKRWHIQIRVIEQSHSAEDLLTDEGSHSSRAVPTQNLGRKFCRKVRLGRVCWRHQPNRVSGDLARRE